MPATKLNTRPGLFTHFYPGGAPVYSTITNANPDPKVTIVEPHQGVKDLYHAYMRRTGVPTLELELEAVRLAKELLEVNVLFSTLTSGMICDTTVDLLFDTFKLTTDRSHERLTPVDMLHALTETHEPGSRLRPAVKSYEVDAVTMKAVDELNRQCMILNWVRRPDGLRDMLLVMYTLYCGHIGVS